MAHYIFLSLGLTVYPPPPDYEFINPHQPGLSYIYQTLSTVSNSFHSYVIEGRKEAPRT